MYQINKEICKPVMDRILETEDAQVDRMFIDSTTKLGGSPCYMQLKRSWGSTVMVVSRKLSFPSISIPNGRNSRVLQHVSAVSTLKTYSYLQCWSTRRNADSDFI